MIGQNHIVCTSAMIGSALCIHNSIYNMRSGVVSNFWGLHVSKLDWLQKLDKVIWQCLGLPDNIKRASALPILGLFLLIVLFGTLCTDCDKEDSIMGKIIHVPVEHRTWLHAIWIPALCFFAGLAFKPAVWFALGWFLHEFMDSFSKMGNSYLYPIVGYRKYGEARVKKGIHNFKLYYAGRQSETIFMLCVVVFCILLSVFFIRSPYHYIDMVGEGFGVLK